MAKGWEQFLKFCLIGASSAVVDIGISSVLIAKLGMFWIAAFTLSFAVAVSNGYIWNSMWTFRGMGNSSRHLQYLKFVAVNIVGLGLNLLIMGLIIFLLTGHIAGTSIHSAPGHVGNAPPTFVLVLAKGTAIVLVAIWNFVANKRWTFAPPAPPAPAEAP